MASVTEAIRALVEYFETLRTVYSDDVDDVDGTGWPRQIVLGSGAVPLTLHSTSQDSVTPCTAELTRHLRSINFDLSSDVAIKVGVLVVEERAYRVVLSISHAAVDKWSVEILRRTFREVLSEGESTLDRYLGLSEQLLQRAAFEQSPRGERIAARTLSFWRQTFSEAPLHMLAGSPEDEAEIERVEIHSHTASRAIDSLSRNYGINSTTALLGAYSIALSSAFDIDEIAIRTLIATRTRRAARFSVATRNLNGPFRIEIDPGDAIDIYFRAAHFAARKAVLYSEANAELLECQLDSILRSRGGQVKQFVFFNDVSRISRRLLGSDGADEGPGTCAGGLAGPCDGSTRLRPLAENRVDKDSKLLLTVGRIQPAVDMILYLDRRWTKTSALPLAHAIEQVLVEAARVPTARLDELLRAVNLHLEVDVSEPSRYVGVTERQNE